MIYTSNLQGRLLDVNEAGVELLGFPGKAELLKIGSTERLYRSAKDREQFLKRINREGYVKDLSGLPSARRLLHPSAHIQPAVRKTPRRAISSWKDHQGHHAPQAGRGGNQPAQPGALSAQPHRHGLESQPGVEPRAAGTLDDVLNLLGLKRGAIILIDRTEKVPAWKRAAGFRNTTSPTPASWCSKISCSEVPARRGRCAQARATFSAFRCGTGG